MDYKISIIIPIYNGEYSLMDTVDSVINQTIGFNNLELILVDDKSMDNSKNVIDNLTNSYKNVKSIYLNVNSGSPGKPRNIGVQNANADYIMFIDCGDTYDKDLCEKFYSLMQKQDVDLISCLHKIYFNDLMQYSINFLEDEADKIFNPNDNENFFKDTYMWNKIFKKDIILKNNIKCLEDGFPEDAYFIINYLFNIKKAICLTNYYGYNYIVPDFNEDINSMSRTVDKNKIFDYISGFYKIINLIRKNGNYNVLHLISNGYMLVLISYFVKFKPASFYEEKEVIDKILELENHFGFKINLNQKWAILINDAILNQNYKKAVLYARIIFIFQNSNFIKKIYRKKINEKSIY